MKRQRQDVRDRLADVERAFAGLKLAGRWSDSQDVRRAERNGEGTVIAAGQLHSAARVAVLRESKVCGRNLGITARAGGGNNEPIRTDKVLEFGCGGGLNLARRRYLSVTRRIAG